MQVEKSVQNEESGQSYDSTIFVTERKKQLNSERRQTQFMSWILHLPNISELIFARNKNAGRGNRTHVLDVTGSFCKNESEGEGCSQ